MKSGKGCTALFHEGGGGGARHRAAMRFDARAVYAAQSHPQPRRRRRRRQRRRRRRAKRLKRRAGHTRGGVRAPAHLQRSNPRAPGVLAARQRHRTPRIARGRGAPWGPAPEALQSALEPRAAGQRAADGGAVVLRRSGEPWKDAKRYDIYYLYLLSLSKMRYLLSIVHIFSRSGAPHTRRRAAHRPRGPIGRGAPANGAPQLRMRGPKKSCECVRLACIARKNSRGRIFFRGPARQMARPTRIARTYRAHVSRAHIARSI